MNTVNNGIPLVPENTIDQAAGLNLALNTIDALLQVLVVSVGLNTPPGSSANGARFIVGTEPTGPWAGQANKLARWLDGAWQFFDARYALNAADGQWYGRSGATWAQLGGVLADGSVTNPKFADMATQTIKGRSSAGVGAPEDLTAAQVRLLLSLAESSEVVFTSLGIGGPQNAAGVWSGLTIRNDIPGNPGPSVEIANNQPVLGGLVGVVASTDLTNSADFRRGAEVRFIRDGGADLSRGSAVQFMTRKGDATGAPTRRLIVTNDGNISIARSSGTPSAAWFGSGEGVFAVGSAAVDPTAAPDAGALIYSSAGRLLVRGASDSAPIVLGQTVLDAFTLATLPAASANPRRQVYVSNLAGQAAPVYSDGTNWRRVSDNTIAN
jgi:hypothetical protein